MDTQHILVVDDDNSIAAMLEHLLAADGHRVSVARDGREALALVAPIGPDLILTDLDMPHLSGNELAADQGRTGDPPAPRLDDQRPKCPGCPLARPGSWAPTSF